MELAEYYKKRSMKEAEERRVARAHEAHTTRYKKHWKNSKQFHIPTKNKNNSEIWTTAQKVHGRRAPFGFPARTASHEQDAQSQRRSAFERLGPNRSQNHEKKERQRPE
jgi:hypothetical protein